MNLVKETKAFIGIMVLLTVVAAGCKDRGPQKQQIGFLMTLDHPYWQNMRLGARDEAQKLGVEVTILNAKEDPVLQIEQIKDIMKSISVRNVQKEEALKGQAGELEEQQEESAFEPDFKGEVKEDEQEEKDIKSEALKEWDQPEQRSQEDT